MKSTTEMKTTPEVIVRRRYVLRAVDPHRNLPIDNDMSDRYLTKVYAIKIADLCNRTAKMEDRPYRFRVYDDKRKVWVT